MGHHSPSARALPYRSPALAMCIRRLPTRLSAMRNYVVTCSRRLLRSLRRVHALQPLVRHVQPRICCDEPKRYLLSPMVFPPGAVELHTERRQTLLRYHVQLVNAWDLKRLRHAHDTKHPHAQCVDKGRPQDQRVPTACVRTQIIKTT